MIKMDKQGQNIIVVSAFVLVAIVVILGATGSLEKFTGTGKASFELVEGGRTSPYTVNFALPCSTSFDCRTDEVCGYSQEGVKVCTDKKSEPRGSLCIDNEECSGDLVCIGSVICGDDPIKVASGRVTFAEDRTTPIEVDLINGNVAGPGVYIGDKGFDASRVVHIKTVGSFANTDNILVARHKQTNTGFEVRCVFASTFSRRECVVEWIAIQEQPAELRKLLVSISGEARSFDIPDEILG